MRAGVVAGVVASVATVFVAEGRAFAQLPLGGRTAQMGGAATANGRDSAMPYLNPAGLAGLPKDLFALSANVYGATRLHIKPFFVKEFAYPAKVEEDSQGGQSVFQLPSSIMYLTSVSDESDEIRHKAGVSLIIPSAIKSTFQGRYRAILPTIFGADNDSRFVSYEYTDYNLGSTYALAVGRWLRLGATWFARYTTTQYSEQSNRDFYGFSGAVQLSRTSSTSQTIATRSTWVKLGAQVSPLDDLWFGVGLSSPTFFHYGSGQSAVNGSDSVLGTSNKSSRTSQYLARDRLPFAVNVGVAYDKPRLFALAVDVTYTAASSNASELSGTSHVTAASTGEIIRDYVRSFSSVTGTRATTNFAVGGEVWAASWLAVRVGGFTSFNNIASPDPAVDGAYTGNGDTFGVTAGLGVLFGPTETSIGVAYLRTNGKMTVPDGRNSPAYPTTLADFHSDTLMFMLAGAVSVKEARDQIEKTLPAGMQHSTLPEGVKSP